jgi:hypothetical protein
MSILEAWCRHVLLCQCLKDTLRSFETMSLRPINTAVFCPKSESDLMAGEFWALQHVEKAGTKNSKPSIFRRRFLSQPRSSLNHLAPEFGPKIHPLQMTTNFFRSGTTNKDEAAAKKILNRMQEDLDDADVQSVGFRLLSELEQSDLTGAIEDLAIKAGCRAMKAFPQHLELQLSATSFISFKLVYSKDKTALARNEGFIGAVLNAMRAHAVPSHGRLSPAALCQGWR